MVAVRRSPRFFGVSDSSDIFLSDLRCNESDSNLLECMRRSPPSVCDHSEDAGVRCGGNIFSCLCTLIVIIFH